MTDQSVLLYYYDTVKALLKAKGEKEILKIFRKDSLRCIQTRHDNWNGGIDFYQVEIAVSPDEYVKLEGRDRIGKIETLITSLLNDASKGDESNVFDGVIIVPSSAVDDSNMEEPITDFSYWNFGYYNIFISHLTKDKISASNLKAALSDYGISCFVAHEDIEPTKLWATEIENALKTMHCLCAIITPEFSSSKWCDQEVGYALGRNILVIPIRKGCDPYGLLGKIQGVQSNGKSANKLAKEIFHILCANKFSQKTYLKTLAGLLLNSKNSNEASKWLDVIRSVKSIDSEIVEFMHSNYQTNKNLLDDTILTKANELFVQHSLKALNANYQTEENVEMDDLPF
jgi:hypothetical protein